MDDPTKTEESPEGAKAGDPPLFSTFGWFWVCLRDTLVVTLILSVAIALLIKVSAGLALAIPAVWTVLFIGSMGVILAFLTKIEPTGSDKVVVLLGVLFKITLFIAGAAGVLLSLRTVEGDKSLVGWILLGLHLLPIVAILHWIVRSKTSASTSATKQAAA